jgi:hypothetical protein
LDDKKGHRKQVFWMIKKGHKKGRGDQEEEEEVATFVYCFTLSWWV